MATRIAAAGVFLALALVPSIVTGQSFVTEEKFNQRNKEVEAQLQEIKRRLDDAEGSIGKLYDLYKRDYDELKKLYKDTNDGLGQISKTISEGGQPRRVLDIQGNMQQPSFRTEMRAAVHDVMRQTGTLRLYNKMPTTQVMRLVYADHRVEYVLYPGEYRDVPVNVGTVTTELVNSGEGPKNWSIAPPSYFQQVDIVPRQDVRFVTQPEVIRIVEPVRVVSTMVEPPILYPIVR